MYIPLHRVFKSLNDHDVRYLVIGGVAANTHGVQRVTFDLDILIDPTLANARQLLNALLEAGLGAASLTTPEDLLAHEITVIRDVLRVDVQTLTPGVEFESAWSRRDRGRHNEQDFWVLCRDDLVAAKRASGRPVDLEDVKWLEFKDDEDG